MKTVYDHLGRKISFSYPPQRIISFVPTITSTMFHIGLENEVVGRTRFCIYPKGLVESAENVGGTKDMKMDRIHELNPDLIMMEKEENTKEMVQQLEQHYPVYVFEVQHIDGALQMITDLGKITGRELEANELRHEIALAYSHLPKMTPRKKVAYVIWQDPFMVAGKNTYINSLLEKLGFINPFVHYDGRYPIVTEDDLIKENLDYILLASEPYPFKEKNLATLQAIVPNASVQLIDGEMFWYGNMMLDAREYFEKYFEKI